MAGLYYPCQAALLLAVIAPVASQAPSQTLNGCQCKKEWKDSEDHTCTDYCCEAGLANKWCIVEDSFCEDASWGICKVDTGAASESASGCEDQAGWHDMDGDGCLYYSSNQWCTSSGTEGLGWHGEWGSIAEFGANGYSAFSACCACGGGKKGEVNPNSKRFSFAGCACQKKWEEEGMKCESSCCNPDEDPAGPWCIVEDAECEDAVWGYCRPEENSVDMSGTASNRHGHCTDLKDWMDVDEEGCQSYGVRAYCTEVGGYGLGWSMDWGTFSEFADLSGKSAPQACCACGGGKRDNDAAAGQGTEVSNSNKTRVTLGQCECKKSWDMENSGKCDEFCCNPDSDPFGDWCMVNDEDCEDSDWGYCATNGLADSYRGPLQDHAHCNDRAGWADSDGDKCDAYALYKWCTGSGKTGPGWHEEWGAVTPEAFTACCVCGGGSLRQDSTSNDMMSSVQALLSEEPDRMWWIASGPCKIDNQGCATSANFPNNYGALEQCQIGVVADKAKPIVVKYFATEYQYDVMKVNGELYSGSRAPNGIIPTSTIFWGTDSQDQKKGWMLCPRGEVVKRKPGLVILKVVSVMVVVLLCCCGMAFLTLLYKTHRSIPHGDGLGAGPTKIGRNYGKQEDA